MAEKVSFPLLNNGNYSTWKVRMQMLLIREDWWFAVDEPKPNPVTPSWKTANQKAMATIVLWLSDSQMNLVKDATSAKDAWSKLKAYHQKASMTSRVSILKRICSVNLVEGRIDGPEMEKHLYELEELFDRLQCAGQELESSLKIAMILRSLPDSYDGLVTALESRKDEDLTMEIVKQKLLDEWQRRSERVVSSSFGTGESALKSVAKAREKVCYYCRKPGHFRRNCRLLKQEQNDGDGGAAEAKQATEKDSSVCFAVRKCWQEGRWFIDSGCSSHMTNDRQFFSKLDEAVKVNVVLADGSVAKSAGVGEGSVQCIDGDGKTKKILIKDVLYIPNLYSGLLSVRTLLQKGFKVEFGASRCGIVDSTGNVVALGELRENLFELKTAGAKMSKNEAKYPQSCKFVWNEKVKCPVNHVLPDPAAKNDQVLRRFGVRSQEELSVKNEVKIKEATVSQKKLPERDEEFVDCNDEDFDYWMQLTECHGCRLQKNQARMVAKMRVCDAPVAMIVRSQSPYRSQRVPSLQ